MKSVLLFRIQPASADGPQLTKSRKKTTQTHLFNATCVDLLSLPGEVKFR